MYMYITVNMYTCTDTHTHTCVSGLLMPKAASRAVPCLSSLSPSAHGMVAGAG